jgi:hypothetical protein
LYPDRPPEALEPWHNAIAFIVKDIDRSQSRLSNPIGDSQGGFVVRQIERKDSVPLLFHMAIPMRKVAIPEIALVDSGTLSKVRAFGAPSLSRSRQTSEQIASD